MTTVLAGLSLGAIYAIVAVGYNIVFIASGVLNFAQAQFLMIGTFVAYTAGSELGLPLPVAVLAAAVVGGIVGGLEEILAIRRLLGRGAHQELVTTLGVATILSGIALVLWGSDPKGVTYFASIPPMTVLGGRTSIVDLLLIGVAVLVAAVVGLITRRTTIGLASLATSENREAGMLRGINVRALATGAFVIGGAVVAAAGPIAGAKTYASFDLGDSLAVKAFVALALGGAGSYVGAVVGAFIVGLVEAFSGLLLGNQWSDLAVFALLLLVLLIIPRGIFGRKSERVV